MSRFGRPLFTNVMYHVTSRGNNKQPVFLEDLDFQRYLRYLKKYKKKFETRLYSFCLMPNHVHLLVCPNNKENLKKFMHGVNMSYAKYFNYKYNKVGHIWQNRYLSRLISKDEYFINCINYIEFNPIRAKLTDRVETYPWSSYSARALDEQSDFIDPLSF